MTHQPGLDPEASKFKALVDEIAAGVVAENAAAVDAEARFPRANIEALREVGLLGLVSAVEVGGHGQGLRAAAAVVERLAQECASTAMITMMHYCGTMVVEAHGNEQLRREIAAGRCLTTLAFSESGSRSHFWAPVSTATANGGKVTLDAKKQLITSAGECDGYVWSSRPTAGDGASTIWWVPSDAAGLSIPARYEGLGLRGNGSAPIHADGVVIPEDNRLGADGAGFDVMMGNVLPPFCLMGQAVSCGIMEGAIARTVGHVTGSKYDYSGDAIASFPQVRAKVATMRTKADMCRAFL
ncbi:MAG: acyl-CoA/acyl-ACP dehydrogenase, partial [Planctomycetes bacterium]|nr:acyl-CoA/acyl-ACP dehydrogenase [Planctomycetota bacterium]